MTIKSKQLFIFIGDDNTGKTTLQKKLIEKICDEYYDRLPTNLKFTIKHPEIKRKYQTIFFGNRSYQEKKEDYITVDRFFDSQFKLADICIISSHLNICDIAQMIKNGKQRYYNVVGVFFSNSIDKNHKLNSQIALLNWDERTVIENEFRGSEIQINRQLLAIADSFVAFIVNRTAIS